MSRTPESASNATAAESYLASFASSDPDVIAAHVSENFANIHTAALGQSCKGRKAYRKRLPGFLQSMPGLAYKVEDLVADENRVMVTYLMTAMWDEETPISIRGVQRLVFEDGLITERTDYWDAAVFLIQADKEAAATLKELGLQRPSS